MVAYLMCESHVCVVAMYDIHECVIIFNKMFLQEILFTGVGDFHCHTVWL